MLPRIAFWIAGLFGSSVLIAAMPMHPALRIALVVIAFCLAVGAVVDFVNRSKGPDVVPGTRSSAELAVSIDQVATRLKEWQDRTSKYEALINDNMEAMKNAVLQAQISRDTFDDRVNKMIQAALASSMSPIAERISTLSEQAARLDAGSISERLQRIASDTEQIYDAARDVLAAQTILPKLELLLNDWSDEAKRQPSRQELAARDNFVNERLPETAKAVELAKNYVDITGFDAKTNPNPIEKQLRAHVSANAVRLSDGEIKSWARSQAKVVGIRDQLKAYIEEMREAQDFARNVRLKRADIPF